MRRATSTSPPSRSGGRSGPGSSGIPGELSDLADLVRAYVRQETVGPLHGLVRFVAMGVAGSLALAIGLVLLTLAGLRALQTQTGSVFAGHLSFVPYLLTLVWCGVVTFLALRAIPRNKESE